MSLLWYMALDENTRGYISPSNVGSTLTGIKGETSGLGQFTLKIQATTGM